MTTRTTTLVAFGATLLGAAVYALSLLPPAQRPEGARRPERPSPGVAVPQRAAPAAPAAPSALQAPAPPAPTPAGARQPAAAPEPASLEALGITEAERAEIKLIIQAAQERMQGILKDGREGKITTAELTEALKRAEAEVTEELRRPLGPERAQQFMRLTHGKLPADYTSPR